MNQCLFNEGTELGRKGYLQGQIMQREALQNTNRRQTLEPKTWERSYRELKSWKPQVYTYSAIQFDLNLMSCLNIICDLALCGDAVLVSAYKQWCYWLGGPWGHSWSCIICDKPYRIFSQCLEPMLWLDQPLWFLLYDCRTQLSNNFQGTLKKKICYSGSRGHMACPGPHSKVMNREKAWRSRALPLLVSEYRVSRV